MSTRSDGPGARNPTPINRSNPQGWVVDGRKINGHYAWDLDGLSAALGNLSVAPVGRSVGLPPSAMALPHDGIITRNLLY